MMKLGLQYDLFDSTIVYLYVAYKFDEILSKNQAIDGKIVDISVS